MSDIPSFLMDQNKTEDKYEYSYYTLFGDHNGVDDNGNPTTDNLENALAYNKKTNKEESFYLKVGAYNRIFNPIGLFSEGKSNKFHSKTGKKEYDFTRVNKRVFDWYINFLRTKNLSWLNNAERELI